MGRNGGCDFRELKEFQKKLEKFNQQQKQQFLVSCTKELAARLLRSLTYNTPKGDYPGSTGKMGGTLQRGWSISKGFDVRVEGDKYVIELVNPIEYASYVNYGHRTRNHKGWVQGKFFVEKSIQEVEGIAPAVLEQKLMRYLSEIFK